MKRKTVALGKPLDTTDEALDILALVTPEDIEDAKAVARERMSERGAALLDAERAEETEADDALPLGA